MSANELVRPQANGATAAKQCRVCFNFLGKKKEDDMVLMVCGGCTDSPRGKAIAEAARQAKKALNDSREEPRDFNAAERALIKKIHGFVPIAQLLSILNDRLVADIGEEAILFTLEQLREEIGDLDAATPAGTHDWATIRKLLANARAQGVLASINEQVIDDFAVVYSLNAKQVMRLKEILLTEEGETQ